MPKGKEHKGDSLARDTTRIPDNWTSDGVSKGKQTGAVRPTADAYNDKKERKGDA